MGFLFSSVQPNHGAGLATLPSHPLPYLVTSWSRNIPIDNAGQYLAPLFLLSGYQEAQDQVYFGVSDLTFGG